MLHIPQNPDSVCSFWVGFPLSTQLHILSLCAKCLSVRLFAVFRDTKWPGEIQTPSPPTCAVIHFIFYLGKLPRVGTKLDEVPAVLSMLC